MYDVLPPSINWTILTPIILMVVTGLIGLVIEMFMPKRTNNLIVGVSLVGLASTAYSLISQFSAPAGETFARMILRDETGILLQLALVATCFLTILFSEGYMREKRIAFAEFYPLVIWSTAGAMIMVSTNSLLMLFIGLEVLSIALYVLAGLSRNELRSEESAIKYFLLGAFASGFLLFGIAYIYGATGSVQMDAIAHAWALNDATTQKLLVFGIGLMLVGFGFKSALVPFHQWAPDVYQGAPTNVTAFMAAGSKIAAIGALYRLLDSCYGMKDIWIPALFWIAILTMVVGNVMAVVQKDVKRILGYSSIANAGYILCAILAHLKAPNEVGTSTVLFYLFNYVFMTMGIFMIISLTAKEGAEGTTLTDLNGLWKRAPLMGGALIVFVASLTGIPVTGGFFAKFFIVQDLLTANMTSLAIVLVITSVISAYYYLSIAYAAVVAEREAGKPEGALPNLAVTAACSLCAICVLALGVLNSPIMAIFGGAN